MPTSIEPGDDSKDRPGGCIASRPPSAASEMASRVHAFEWAATPLAAMQQWPAALQTAVGICLDFPLPMFVWWGRGLINIYNDACIPLLGKRHPDALGRPAAKVLSDIWPSIGADVWRVINDGVAVVKERVRFVTDRDGHPEETFFTCSHSPLPDGKGGIGGLLQICTDEMPRVRAEREDDRLFERRRRAEAALRNSEAEIERQARLFDATLSSIRDFAHTFDRDGRFLYANAPLAALLGLEPWQMVGKNFVDLNYPKELAERLNRQIRQVFDTGRTLVDETPFVSPTGVEGYYEYIFSPVIGRDGTVEAVAGTTRDVTVRKQVEAEREQLRSDAVAAQTRMAGAFQGSPTFMAVLRGPRHVFELANDALFKLVGHRDIVGKPAAVALPELEAQGYIKTLDRVYGTGEPFIGKDLPVLFQREPAAALERRFVEFANQPLRDADGSISGIFVHGIDTTERLRNEQALRDSEERVRLAVAAARIGYWSWDLASGVTALSDTCAGLFGLSGGGPVPIETVFNAIHPGDRDAVEAAANAAVKGASAYEAEFRVVLPDGATRWLGGRGNIVRDPGGNAVRMFGINIDISDRKLAEQDRELLLDAERAARAEAEAANRAKDKFLAVLSHELRTPLSPVVMTLPAMEMDPDLPFKFREDLAMVRRNIELEVKLIDDLLDLSRVTTGKLRLHIQPVGVHELLRHAVQNSIIDTAGKRLGIVHRLDARQDQLSADPARLQQVFWNLLRNAVKFTPDGGDILVRTWNSGDGTTLYIEIKDTGVGIPPEVLPRVFDAFEQGEVRMTSQFGGLGLGLAVAKAVVEMHGGDITADSPGRGQGATFIVRLNIAPAPDVASVPVAGETGPAAGGCSRVLLVEDHPDTARTLARLLRKHGHEVKTADSVASAIQIAGVEAFDVVVSDIGLPDATGYELMEQLRARYGLKGIALSGYGMEEDMRKSREAGFAEHVVKPVNVSQLAGLIRRVIGVE